MDWAKTRAQAKQALQTVGLVALVVMVLLAFFGTIPQAEFTEREETTDSSLFVYKIVPAKTVCNRYIQVHLKEPALAFQVTISTWVWCLHAAVHILVDGEEVAQVNAGSSGSANLYMPLPKPSKEVTVWVWSHNVSPITLDFHAAITFYP